METGTLDFDDLMDTGDEYPGFEIAKFTPANVNKEEDSILKTPEHTSEDYGEDDAAERKERSAKRDENNREDDAKTNEVQKANRGLSANRAPDKENATDDNESKPAMNRDFTSDEEASNHKRGRTDEEEEDADGAQESSHAAKKKKYLMPPKPRMALWSSQKKKEKERSSPDVSSQEETSRDSQEPNTARSESESKLNGDSDSNSNIRDGSESESRGGDDKKTDDDDPHQQSFLSFFNLKPGSAASATEKKKSDSKKLDDFYSRKRLRTRKKVSYVEDVTEDQVDEEYKGEGEEEDIEDHLLTLPRRRNSGGGVTPKAKPVAGAASYALALQNLTPTPKGPGRPPSISPANQAVQMALALQRQKQATPTRAVVKPDPAGNSLMGMSNPGNVKGLFECGLCGTFFNTASHFIAHQEQVHATENKSGRSGMETFRCEICQFVLTNRFAYLEHKRMKHMKNQVTFSCHKCGRSFGYLMDLQKHKDECGINSPMCGLCNLKFPTLQELVHHRHKMHSGNNTRQWLTCINKTCTFKCLTQHEMNQHVKNKHMTSELFSCSAPRCSRIFSTREHLNEHRKEAHASEFIVQYQCMECKMCYSSKTLLAEHQYLHTMDKLRKCDICMRQFTTMNQLKRHKEVHSSKGTVQCTSCSRWCLDKQELVNHLCKEKKGRFPGMLLYFCDICMKDFRADEVMFKHRREHKGYYQCSTCLWECTSEAEYFEHREIHELYTCTECCEELQSASELETHMKAHKYNVRLIQIEIDGKNGPAMYLCPNLINMIKA